MLEHESVSGVVESMKVVTAANSERVARYGFEFAKKHGRKKVKVNFKFFINQFDFFLLNSFCL